MKKHTWLLNILLIVEVFAVCVAALLTEVFAPSAMLPKNSIPLMVLLTAVPLAIEYYVGVPVQRNWPGSILLAAATFAMAGLVTGEPMWLLFLVGGAVFTVVTVLYTSMGSRMKSGPRAKAAPAVNALLLVLAAQFFQGIL